VPVVHLETSIDAPIERVFDLCRSVDAHVATSGATDERAVGGVTTGLMALGDEVTWSARHLGRRWRLTSRITVLERPHRLVDEQVAGVFARFRHDHLFEMRGAVTVVRDAFDYTSPLGPLGRIADRLVVERHMVRFLAERMDGIRRLAEGEGWRRFLGRDRD